jgi:hypothetical protein
VIRAVSMLVAGGVVLALASFSLRIAHLQPLNEHHAAEGQALALSHARMWRAQEDLNPRARIRSPLLYPG